jgi:hypothetical protein
LGQSEVLEFLEKQKEPVALRTIEEALGQVGSGAVPRVLRILMRWGEVKSRKVNKLEALKYNHKGAINLYYVNRN